MKLEWYVARRYLGSRRRSGFASLITLISAAGVFVGVMALILVTAVMTGLQQELREQLLTTTAHLWVLERDGDMRMENHEEVLARVRAVPGVVAAAPFVNAEVGMVTMARYPEAVALRGLDVAAEGPPVTDILLAIREGELHLDTARTATGYPPLLVGDALAARLGLHPGTLVRLLTIQGGLRIGLFGFAAPPDRFEVVGEFEGGLQQHGDRLVYTTLTAAQALTGLGDAVTGLEVRTESPERAVAVARDIDAVLGPGYFTQDWYSMNESLFDALQLERLAMRIILFLIVLVAAFNIVGTLVMLVVGKTREIGILRAMGLRSYQIRRIFLLQGLAIGALGGTAGAAGALLLIRMQERFGIVRVPQAIDFLDRLPVAVNLLDVAAILVVTVLVSLLAALYPAHRAAQLAPVEAIRSD